MEIVIPFLVFVAIVGVGTGILWGRAGSGSPRQRVKELERQLGISAPANPGSFAMKSLGRLGRVISPKAPSQSLKERLSHAGFHHTSAPRAFLGSKFLLLALGLIAGIAVSTTVKLRPPLALLVLLVPGGLLFFVPNWYLAARRRGRTAEVRRSLPDMVDLLEICVAAGMGIDMAWNAVTDEIRRLSSVLADEMALTNLEIHLGEARAGAMRHMSERTRVEELGSLVAMLVQSERFGTSIGETLNAFAQSMREERSMRTQESAEKMAVKLLFPMVLFIFPAMLIVLVGPALILLFKEMSQR